MTTTPDSKPRRVPRALLALSALAVNLLVLAVLYVARSPVVAAGAAPAGTPFKVTTFNTEYWHIPEEELVAFVRYQDMDIVFLQEHLEKRGNSWGPTERIAQLRAALKDRHVDVNGEVVTVSKWPIVGTRAFTDGNAVRTDVRGPDGRIVSAYNVHLPVHIHLELASNPIIFYRDAEATAERRQVLLDEVLADLQANPNPLIVAGDFNSSPAMNGAAWFRGHMTDAYAAPQCAEARDTFEIAGVLTWRIDYVFVSHHFKPTSYCTRAAPEMSDHKAIVAGLDLLQPRAAASAAHKDAP